jgi:folate-binding Fe-S cluster repair protein YgfZ
MRDRGNVRKRLALLRLAGAELPAAGDKIVVGGQSNAGQVTSAARLAGEPAVALAILANAVPVGAQLRIQHAAAELAAEVVADAPPWG